MDENVMPVNYKEYPPDWWKMRDRILKRANNRCEWCGAENHKPHPVTGSKVVLTIAHLDHDHDNWNVTDDRLAALCQRCHLNYDRPRHVAKRKYGRNYDGPQQLQLFDEAKMQKQTIEIRKDITRMAIKVKSFEGPYSHGWKVLERFKCVEELEKRFADLLKTGVYKEG